MSFSIHFISQSLHLFHPHPVQYAPTWFNTAQMFRKNENENKGKGTESSKFLGAVCVCLRLPLSTWHFSPCSVEGESFNWIPSYSIMSFVSTFYLQANLKNNILKISTSYIEISSIFQIIINDIWKFMQKLCIKANLRFICHEISFSVGFHWKYEKMSLCSILLQCSKQY
jgi:hypothetical protein